MPLIDDLLKVPFEFIEMAFKEGWVIIFIIALIGGGLYFLFFV